MTIYTAPQNDKDKAKLLQDESGPEVVDGSQTALDMKEDAGDSPGPRVVQVTFFRRNGRLFYIHLLFALAVLVVMAFGALSAVVFYRHIHKKVYSGKCGTIYFDTTYHKDFKPPVADSMTGQEQPDKSPNIQLEIMEEKEVVVMGENEAKPSNGEMDLMKEDVIVMEDEQFEELHTPAFDEVRESYIRHNFALNFTAIVDHEYKQCFVMKLNRTAIAPPRNLLDLLQLVLMAESYFRRASVIRLDFEVAYALEDLSQLGSRIAQDCALYPTHWLEKRVSGVYKRSVKAIQQEEEEDVAYALMSNFVDNPVIFKVFVHHLMKTEKIVVNKKVSPAA